MNNPNPFVPKGSLLEQQSQRRSRLKLVVFCVLTVSVAGLVVMLIQGCKRENPDAQPTVDTNNVPPLEMPTNPPAMDTNPPAAAPIQSNAVVIPPVVPPPVAPVVETPAAGGTYEIVSGDTLAKIAKKNGVSLKALENANPGVDPKKLKPKMKLNLPASTKGTDSAAVTPAGAATTTDVSGSGETYVVKSGDTLSKIAKKNHISVKTLRAANPKLASTDHIKVGDKLSIPAKTEAAAAPAAPTPDTTPAPVLPPPVAPSTPAPAPAPGH
jgi:LysM repeat protein